MGTRRSLSASAAVLGAMLHVASVQAVALRPNKATDDSVCDLTHQTNGYLGSKTLVPYVASTNDQVDAYFRLAGNFVANKCRNGQTLMLQGASSSAVDVRSLTELANTSCAVASVSRSEVTLTYGDMTQPGFELHCTIVKRDELATKLDELEHADPMEALKAHMYAPLQQGGRGTSSAASPGPSDKKDCGKMTLASLLRGGACK